MRHLGYLAAASVSALLATSACETEESSSPLSLPSNDGGLAIDGATTTVPMADGGTDADPPVTTGVVVTVVSSTVPTPGARVLSHDASGALVGDATTDASGKVILATAPSQITVVRAAGMFSDAALVTYVGVAPGDVLVVEMAGGGVPNPVPIGQYSVTWSAPSADSFLVSAGLGCVAGSGGTTEPIALPIFSHCHRPAISLLGVAYDIDGIPLAYHYRTGVAPPVGNTAVATSLPSTTGIATRTVTASNLPAEANAKLIALGNVSDGAVYLETGETTGYLDDEGVSVPMPDNFGDSLQALVAAETDRGSPQFASTGFLRRFATAPTVAFDFATALPRFSDGNVTMSAPKRPEVTWTTAAPMTGADGGFVVVNWTIEVLGDTSTSGTWTFVVPPGTSSVTAPELPGDLASYAPTLDYGGPDLTQIVFVESDAVPDYAALKKLPMGGGGAAAMLSSFRPLPQLSTVRLTAFRQDLDSLVPYVGQ